MDEIKKYIEDYLNIEDISIRSRVREYAYARALFCKLAHELQNKTFEAIGEYSKRDRITARHSIVNTFPVAFESSGIIQKCYNDYKAKDNKIKLLIDGYESQETESLAVKIIHLEDVLKQSQEVIKELKSKKDIDNKGINSLLIKFNQLTEDKQDTFILRADAILKMLNY